MAGTTLSTGRDVMTEPIRVTASGPAAQVVLEVDAGLSIAGKVVGPNGEPVAQALVQLIDATVMTGGRVLAIDEPGPDGLFEINGLAERSYTVLARRAPHLHAVTRYGVATLPDIRAGRRDIVLTLPFLAHLEIHVVDARGQDVRGAMVRLLSARGEESSGATVGSGIVRFSYPAYEAAELRVSPPNPPDGASRTTEQSIPVEPGDPGEQVMIEVVLDA
jgi:hypothetical protein